MKKVLIIILILFAISACGKSTNERINLYDELVNEVKLIKESSQNLPFNTELKFERLNEEEVLYTLTIDNPSENLNNIIAVLINDYNTDDVFPSVGIFEEPFNLSNEEKDKDTKGFILGGYLKYKGELENLNISFKAIIKSDDNTYNYYEKY